MSTLTQLKKPIIAGAIAVLGITGATAFAVQPNISNVHEGPATSSEAIAEPVVESTTPETSAETTQTIAEPQTSTETASDAPGAPAAPTAATSESEPVVTEPAPEPVTIVGITKSYEPAAPIAGQAMESVICHYAMSDGSVRSVNIGSRSTGPGSSEVDLVCPSSL